MLVNVRLRGDCVAKLTLRRRLTNDDSIGLRRTSAGSGWRWVDGRGGQGQFFHSFALDKVVRLSADKVADDDVFDLVRCSARKKVHLVNPKTGKELGEEED